MKKKFLLKTSYLSLLLTCGMNIAVASDVSLSDEGLLSPHQETANTSSHRPNPEINSHFTRVKAHFDRHKFLTDADRELRTNYRQQVNDRPQKTNEICWKALFDLKEKYKSTNSEEDNMKNYVLAYQCMAKYLLTYDIFPESKNTLEKKDKFLKELIDRIGLKCIPKSAQSNKIQKWFYIYNGMLCEKYLDVFDLSASRKEKMLKKAFNSYRRAEKLGTTKSVYYLQAALVLDHDYLAGQESEAEAKDFAHDCILKAQNKTQRPKPKNKTASPQNRGALPVVEKHARPTYINEIEQAAAHKLIISEVSSEEDASETPALPDETMLEPLESGIPDITFEDKTSARQTGNESLQREPVRILLSEMDNEDQSSQDAASWVNDEEIESENDLFSPQEPLTEPDFPIPQPSAPLGSITDHRAQDDEANPQSFLNEIASQEELIKLYPEVVNSFEKSIRRPMSDHDIRQILYCYEVLKISQSDLQKSFRCGREKIKTILLENGKKKKVAGPLTLEEKNFILRAYLEYYKDIVNKRVTLIKCCEAICQKDQLRDHFNKNNIYTFISSFNRETNKGGSLTHLADRQKIINDYQNGKTLYEIVDEHPHKISDIYDVLSDLFTEKTTGLNVNIKKSEQEIRDTVIQCFHRLSSDTKKANTHSVSQNLKQQGEKIGPKVVDRILKEENLIEKRRAASHLSPEKIDEVKEMYQQLTSAEKKQSQEKISILIAKKSGCTKTQAKDVLFGKTYQSTSFQKSQERRSQILKLARDYTGDPKKLIKTIAAQMQVSCNTVRKYLKEGGFYNESPGTPRETSVLGKRTRSSHDAQKDAPAPKRSKK